LFIALDDGRRRNMFTASRLGLIGLSSVLRPLQHSIGYIWETVFTGQQTQPTVSKYWKRIASRLVSLYFKRHWSVATGKADTAVQ